MRAVVTVIGKDRTGIIFNVSKILAENNVNIEDISQTVMHDFFTMIMLVDISNCNVSHEELHKRTDTLAAEMGMQINVTRQEVFDAMHTI